MRLKICLLLLNLFIMPAISKNLYAKDRISVSAFGSVNINNYKEEYFAVSKFKYVFTDKGLPGISIGSFVKFPLTSHFGFISGINLTTPRIQRELYYKDSRNEISEIGNITALHGQVPILLYFKIGKRIYFSFGCAYNYQFYANYSSKINYQSPDSLLYVSKFTLYPYTKHYWSVETGVQFMFNRTSSGFFKCTSSGIPATVRSEFRVNESPTTVLAKPSLTTFVESSSLGNWSFQIGYQHLLWQKKPKTSVLKSVEP